MKNFTINPISFKCIHCIKAEEKHNFFAHFGDNKDIPIFCNCGEVLLCTVRQERVCAYCGRMQYCTLLICPIEKSLRGNILKFFFYLIFYSIKGVNPNNHASYKGNLKFKYLRNAKSKPLRN